MTSPKCGGELLGDGYTSVIECENTTEDTFCMEPDSGPVLCDFEEVSDEKD